MQTPERGSVNPAHCRSNLGTSVWMSLPPTEQSKDGMTNAAYVRARL